MPKDLQETVRSTSAQILVKADYLQNRGDATLDFLREIQGLSVDCILALLRAAGLDPRSHHLNDGTSPYREQLDLEIAGHVLSLEDRIRDRTERFTLIENAIEAATDEDGVLDFEEALRHIQKNRPSGVTLEKSPEEYRKSFEAMKQDLLMVLHLRGVSTFLEAVDITRLFGVEEDTFHANFDKMISELREEHGIDGAAIHQGDQNIVAYKFEVFV